MKTDIKSLTFDNLQRFFEGLNQPAYRAGQVFKWLSQGKPFDEMSNLSKDLRRELAEKCELVPPKIAAKSVSKKDGTTKYLFELADGSRVETVLMRYRHGISACLSTQAGCKMGCIFCASFDPGACRNLTAGEMLDQMIFAQHDSGEKISSIVLMGTGEPLDNFENVLAFLDILSDERGTGMSLRHVSLSTCGIVPKIDELARLKLQLTLSVSLHAPTDAVRSQIMPINRKYPIDALIPACRRYFKATGRRISFEYAMISGVNDSPQHAAQLASLISDMGCHVNLIPLNRVPGSALKPSDPGAVRRFQAALTERNINATVRRSLGGDIDAACGQLRRRSKFE